MIKLQLNQNLNTPKGKLIKGAIIELEADKSGNPLNIFWRRRLKDSKIDNCVSIIKDNLKNKK